MCHMKFAGTFDIINVMYDRPYPHFLVQDQQQTAPHTNQQSSICWNQGYAPKKVETNK